MCVCSLKQMATEKGVSFQALVARNLFAFFFYFFFLNFGCTWDLSFQGLNPCPLHWKHGGLATGLAEKSLLTFFFARKENVRSSFQRRHRRRKAMDSTLKKVILFQGTNLQQEANKP